MIRFALVGALVLATCGGCGPPETRVVVVIESDLAPAKEVDSAVIFVDHGLGAGSTVGGRVDRFPTSFGVVPHTQAWFSGNMELRVRDVAILRRSFSHVRFVSGTTRMFVLEMRKACLCEGTNCPDPETNPDCGPLVDPALLPFEGDPPIGNTVAP